MLAVLPIELQVYAFGLALGITVPILLFWLLHRPLREFLKEIFHSSAIEQFWLRVVLLGFLASTLSVAVVFQPAAASKTDEVALFFNVADKFKQMLDSLMFVMLATFLPLLAAYTILHIPRRGKAPGPQAQEPA
jgi:prolipoprotein diacylglyceryltransferase